MYMRTPGISKQVTDKVTALTKFGRSKAADKAAGATPYIYSYTTAQTYTKRAILAAKWIRDEHGIKDITQMAKYVPEYIEHQKDRGLSPWTIQLDACACEKVFGCPRDAMPDVPTRTRADISRSREETDRTRAAEKQAPEIAAFCRATGLRRAELEAATCRDVHTRDGRMYIHVGAAAKGGRERDACVIDERAVRDLIRGRDGNDKIFDHVPSHMPVHAYRADYANDFYQMRAKDVDVLKYTRAMWTNPKTGREESRVYCCRGDKAGTWYDKAAMYEVTQSLGHNRIDVIAYNYLR